ncbi:MAG: hypothetical protein IH623_13885 [Verrucomicrobia bacterium]|nr:hypothetical protein [Verrucomicrobiota bacterium]
MKLLLTVSLMLNLLLLGAAVRRGAHQHSNEFARPLRTQVAPATPASNFFQRRPSLKTAPATPWEAIESRDPRQLIASLRAIGCPEQTIRDIVVTRISREFHGRLQAAYDDEVRQRPWWRGTPYSRQSLELSQLRFRLRGERDDLLEELFGEPATLQWFQVLSTRGPAVVGREFLPLEKKTPLREIEARYRQWSAEVTFPVGQALDEEERGELLDLQRRKRAEIEALLTPHELEELDVRGSAAAIFVRRKLPEADSEAEFRAMVQAALEGGVTEGSRSVESFASRFGIGMEAASERQERFEEDQLRAIEARIKELLSEQRFAEMQQAEAERQAAEQAH